MSSSADFADFVIDQLRGIGLLSKRKMFGEYCLYVNGRPVLLICDNTVYIKTHPELASLLADNATAPPYDGAKPWYVLDAEDSELLRQAVQVALPLTPLPKKRRKL